MESLNGQNGSTLIEDISAPEIIISVALILLSFKCFEWNKIVSTLGIIGVFAFLLNLSKPVLFLIDALSAALMIITGLLLYQEFMEGLNRREAHAERRGASQHQLPEWFSFVKGLLAVTVMSASAYFIARLGSR
jgi:hypothetical protein